MKLIFTTLMVLLLAINLQAQSYVLNGDAQFTGDDCYQLTSAVNNQNGTVWYEDQLDLTSPFEIEFLMNFGTNDGGADGMVFVLQTVGTDALGATGGGMGYQGFAPSLGIEFDTYTNGVSGDLAEDHIGFMSNGSVDHLAASSFGGPVTALSSGGNIEDGNDYVVKVTWNPETQNLAVYFDCELRLEAEYDVVETIFLGDPIVWWGFSAGTGSLSNNQTVCLQENILSVTDSLTSCANEGVQLNAVGSLSGDYNWNPDTGLSASDIPDPIANPSETTTYYVTFTDFCGFEKTDSTTVVVQNTNLDLGADTLICLGGSLVLDATTEGATYEWQDGSSDSTFEINDSGIYWLDLTLNGCTARDSINIEIGDVFAIDLGEDNNICEGESMMLSALTEGAEYLWSDESTEAELNVTSTGTYSVTVTLDGCTAEDEITIEVSPLPTVELGEDITACQGSEVNLSANAEADEYLWSDESTASELTVSESGTYSLTLTQNGCSASDEIQVTFNELEAINLGDDQSICDGETVLLDATTEGASYEWQDGSTAPTFNATEAGTYSVTIDIDGCQASGSVNVSVEELPDLYYEDVLGICEIDTLLLAVVNEDNSPISSDYTFEWQDGSTESSLMLTEEGTYWVDISNGSCTKRDSIEVFTYECEIFLPIELLDFSGQALTDANLVQWRTIEEINNAYFVLEKSLNGIDYIPLAEINALDNEGEKFYSYQDKNIANSLTYYRLKQIDQNGQVNIIDKILAIERNLEEPNIYPNPTSGQLNISIANSFIEIFDLNGRLQHQTITKESPIQINNLNAGVYYVRINHQNVQKIIVY